MANIATTSIKRVLVGGTLDSAKKLTSCPASSDEDYNISTGIDLTTKDFVEDIRGLLLVDGTGDIDLEPIKGGRMVLTFNATSDTVVFDALSIKKLWNKNTGNTTFDGAIIPCY